MVEGTTETVRKRRNEKPREMFSLLLFRKREDRGGMKNENGGGTEIWKM